MERSTSIRVAIDAASDTLLGGGAGGRVQVDVDVRERKRVLGSGSVERNGGRRQLTIWRGNVEGRGVLWRDVFDLGLQVTCSLGLVVGGGAAPSGGDWREEDLRKSLEAKYYLGGETGDKQKMLGLVREDTGRTIDM
jgi:hypothetical protein